jgi:hypothetical protein
VAATIKARSIAKKMNRMDVFSIRFRKVIARNQAATGYQAISLQSPPAGFNVLRSSDGRMRNRRRWQAANEGCGKKRQGQRTLE